MTRKQKKDLAKKIYQCEKIHQNPDSSLEEKSRAENKIIQITDEIMELDDGINIMLELDVMVQALVSKEKN